MTVPSGTPGDEVPEADWAEQLAEALQQLGTGEAVVTVMDPDGTPTPVAWTRMRAPQSLMAPTPADVLRPGIASSSLMGRYGAAVDRDSAREMLARKLEAGAAAAAEERQAQEAAQRYEREGRRPSGSATRSRTRSAPRVEKSVVQQVVASSAFRQFARTAGREIVRSLFGTARRR